MFTLFRHPKSVLTGAAVLLASISSHADVSAFVSLQDDYLNERIAQLAVATDMSAMRRPYSVAYVRQQLSRIRSRMPGLYREIDTALSRYEQSWNITQMTLAVAGETENETTQINHNARGETIDASYRASASVLFKPTAFTLLQIGALRYDGSEETLPVDSYIVIGGDSFAFDFGFREHWLSNFRNGAMLYSTNARPSVSAGISNPLPFADYWDFQYDIFLTRLERHGSIRTGTAIESGSPFVLGSHFSFSPLSGWTIGLTRTMQFGGGSREVGASDVWNAFVDPTGHDNDFGDLCAASDPNCEFGNQQAALSSRLNFAGDTPFSLYFEFAGEDTASAKNTQLGNLAVSYGVYIPFMPAKLLGPDWSLRYEHQQWQNAWYTHHIYMDGYTNDGVVMGHWGANQRVYNDEVGARSQMLQFGRQLGEHERFETTWRWLENDDYGVSNYHTARELSLRYYTRWWQQNWQLEVMLGNDVFDNDYSRIELAWNF